MLSTDDVNVTLTKLLNLSSGDEVGLELKASGATTATLDYAGFNLTSIGTGGSSGGGTPAAPVNSVQFNNAGAFGGSSQFIFDSATNRVGIGNARPENSTFVTPRPNYVWNTMARRTPISTPTRRENSRSCPLVVWFCNPLLSIAICVTDHTFSMPTPPMPLPRSRL